MDVLGEGDGVRQMDPLGLCILQPPTELHQGIGTQVVRFEREVRLVAHTASLSVYRRLPTGPATPWSASR